MSPKTPIEVADYHVLPLRILPISSCPNPTTHYIYVRPHTPNIPQRDSPRSLFIVNVPFDSTDLYLRSLFADQLGGGRIERVEFETSRPQKKAAFKPTQTVGRKKRKRADVEAEELADCLPETWDRELHGSGSTAVAVFVDKPSMELALKAVKKAASARTELQWGKGMEERVPSLGSQRVSTFGNLKCNKAYSNTSE